MNEKDLIKEQAQLIRETNEILEAQNRKLIELDIEKNQIISIVSHDLKSPLNRVFALSNLIKMSGDNLTVEQLDYIDKIHIVVSEGLNMIKNLLDIRNIEDQRIILSIEKVNIDGLLTDLVREYESIGKKKEISISIKGKPKNLVIEADKQYLKRIFENILSNAIKYTRLGHKVEITIRDSDVKSIIVGIKDDGYGIKKEDYKKLFQKFSILSSKPTGGESSYGLGLSIVKGLVDKLNGDVWCESTEGYGATFFVRLPKVYKEG